MISRKEVRVPKILWWHTNPSYVSFKMPRDLDATSKVSWAFLVAQVVKKPTSQCRRHKRCGFDPWVRKILPGQFHGQRSLASYSPWGHKESDTTEQLTHAHTHTESQLCVFPALFYPHNQHFGCFWLIYFNREHQLP